MIEYGILKVKTETDYYQNKKQIGSFVWSIFDFENQTFEYYIEKPNEELVSLSEKGKLKYENPTRVSKINKVEFEKYIVE